MNGQEINVIFRCHTLPGTRHGDHDAVRLGIQCGKVVIEDQPADLPEIVFRFGLRVLEKEGGAGYDFRGEYVQGPTGERFVYLNWGERVGDAWAGFGRVKIPLHSAPTDFVAQAIRASEPLCAEITMTDARGRPICATVREPILIWKRPGQVEL